MNKQKRIEIFTRLREANPNPTTELNYSSPFELLIAVILSAQATDVGVNKATDKLFPVANTPEAILALGVDGLKEYIKTIGLCGAGEMLEVGGRHPIIVIIHGNSPNDIAEYVTPSVTQDALALLGPYCGAMGYR